MFLNVAMYILLTPLYWLIMLLLIIGISPFALCRLPKGVTVVSIRATNRSQLRSTLRFSFTLN